MKEYRKRCVMEGGMMKGTHGLLIFGARGISVIKACIS